MGMLNIIDKSKKVVGTIELGEEIVSPKLNKAILYQAVRANLSALHHGTVDTKTRAEVNRTNKKVYKQKGTGSARHGSRKTAPFVGGGRVFGPHQRDFTIRLTKKAKRLALREAFRDQIKENRVTVLNSFPFTQIKTKEAAAFLKNLNLSRGLVVLGKGDEVVEKSIRNIVGFKVVKPSQVSVVDLIKYKNLLVSEETFREIQKNYLS